MQQFTILGERCTGTHFLQYAIQQNFKIPYYRGAKHFFGHNDDIEYTDEIIDKTIFFVLVRHPVDWVDSFYKRLHHVPQENKKDIDSFLTNEWYSIYEEGSKKNTEIMEDRNIETKERYTNIFEMRKGKHNYLINILPSKVKKFCIVKYEDLRDDYENTLDRISRELNLVKKESPYAKIIKYKGSFNALYYKKPILLPNSIQYKIEQNVDIEQEKILGYSF